MAELIRAIGDLKLWKDDGKIVMTGGKYGTHELTDADDHVRYLEHWKGYLANNGATDMVIEARSTHSDEVYSVSWEHDGFRYHVWFKKDGSIDGDTAVHHPQGEKAKVIVTKRILYKNKIDNVRYREPGYYETRKLDLDAQTHTDTRESIEHLIAVTDLDAIFQKGVEKERAEQEAKRNERGELLRKNLGNWLANVAWSEAIRKQVQEDLVSKLSTDDLHDLYRELHKDESGEVKY